MVVRFDMGTVEVCSSGGEWVRFSDYNKDIKELTEVLEHAQGVILHHIMTGFDSGSSVEEMAKTWSKTLDVVGNTIKKHKND